MLTITEIKSEPAIVTLMELVEKKGYIAYFPAVAKDPLDDNFGFLNAKDEEIAVYRTNPLKKREMSLGDIIFVLAHLTQHLVHRTDDHYPEYYAAEITATNVEDHLRKGLLAEKDCDRYAKYYTREKGFFSTLAQRTYPLKRVGRAKYYRSIGYLDSGWRVTPLEKRLKIEAYLKTAEPNEKMRPLEMVWD